MEGDFRQLDAESRYALEKYNTMCLRMIDSIIASVDYDAMESDMDLENVTLGNRASLREFVNQLKTFLRQELHAKFAELSQRHGLVEHLARDFQRRKMVVTLGELNVDAELLKQMSTGAYLGWLSGFRDRLIALFNEERDPSFNAPPSPEFFDRSSN